MTPDSNPRAEPSGGFGAELRRLRLRAHLTQEELAEQSGVSPRTISELERGARKAPQFASAELLAEALHLDGAARAAFFGLVRGERSVPGKRSVPGTMPDAGPDLPAQGPPILGRELELAELGGFFADGGRLVTLLGPGGIGKTRLALEFARSQPARTVIWTACEVLSHASEVIPAALRAAQIMERPECTPAELLASVLRGRQSLLVLDNLEHLVDIAPELTSLLEAAPDLRILATSREALRIKSERIMSLGPLAPPSGESAQELLASPAVKLFTRSTPGHSLPDSDLATVGRIVSLLDGLPLAIELAAAQNATLTIGAIAELLDHIGLPALGSWRDGVQRFRTMDAAVRWSTDLLPPPAQRLMRLLSVVRGGASLETIAELASHAGAPELAAALPRLVDASIVRASSGSTGRTRFRMLEPVRMAALADLAAAGEERAARDAHLAVMVDVAERASRAQLSHDAAAALEAFAAERANLLAALDHACATGKAAIAMRLAIALGFWWEQIGEIHIASQRLARVIALDDGVAPPRDRWLVRWLGALMAHQAGDYDQLRDLADAALAIASAAGDADGEARARIALALWLQMAKGSAEEATRELDTAISLAADPRCWLARGYAYSLRATFRCYALGETERPLADFRQALKIFDAHAPHLSEMPLLNMSAALQTAGRREEAAAAVRKALDLNLSFGNPLVEALGAWRLALLISEDATGANARQAARLLGVVEWLFNRHGYVSDQLMREESGPGLARLRDVLGDRLDDEIAAGRALAEARGAGMRAMEAAQLS